MDITNCDDPTQDGSSVADESASAAGTDHESATKSTSPGPSGSDVRRKRRSSNEIFNRKLLKKNVTDLNGAVGEEPKTGVANSTASTTNSYSKMDDSGVANEESDTRVEQMDDNLDETAASEQPSRDEVSSSSSSSTSSNSSSSSITSTSDADPTLDCEDDNDMNNSDSAESSDAFDVVSWSLGVQVPFDDDSSSSIEELTKDGKSSTKLPNVLNRELPKEKFSFLNAIADRQIKGDDPKRRGLQRFDNKVYASRRMVQHLKLYKSLKKHNGCVNCVSFNHSGEILISTSEDKHVCLWDWSRNKSLLFYDSGHLANVCQAKFLPYSNDTKLITCGQDSQIRMSVLDQCGLHSTGLIVKHEKTVHKIALQPQMPNTFLSAGEDGIVYSIDIREPKPVCSKLLRMAGPRANSFGCLYSIHCNPLKNYEFVVSGNDKIIRMFDQRKISLENAPPVLTFCPNSLLTEETSARKYSKSVSSAMFSYNGSEILSSHNDNDIYLFDATTGKEVHRYDGHRNFATIKGVNFFGPRSEYIVSGSDCGYVYIWDKDSEAIVQWVKGDESIVNCLEPHPSFPVLATCGLDPDVKIWMPLSPAPANIRGLRDFAKVTRKNHYYKGNNFAHMPGRSLVVPLIIDPENVAFREARSRLPVILRYRRSPRYVLRRRNQQPARSSSDDDTPSDRDCDLPF